MGKASTPGWRLAVERVKIKGQPRYLWKAVDEAGQLLEFYATEERDEAAARQFFDQALKDPWAKPVIRSGVSTRRRK
ncbi:DDE-type integrase/transposase/recombinase [Altericroceibacterium xinjiangense]|uniref:DDE-type integrase/transposase/recombinase n=1 Tax=Altericroceibacterium xinjiangense TaxID=762261 RepID=UPI000F7FA71A|nr:DDE-type integrase/transposase/recombinase [Altericroceibacterium xinjiangense]